MASILAVIALPTLLPLVALLQLLFPGMLRDQARHYRRAVQVLLTQSSLIFLQWALLRWVVTGRYWWLSDEALWCLLGLVALVGLIASIFTHLNQPAEASAIGALPVSLEFWALGTMAAVGLVWILWAIWSGQSPWDQMAVVTAAALAGLLHLGFRKWLANSSLSGIRVATETVFLFVQVAATLAIGVHVYGATANRQSSAVAAEWPTYRGNVARTGSADPRDRGPLQPRLLWTFDPAERSGRVFMHASPTVVGNSLYVGAMHQLLGSAEGYLYCVDASHSGTDANQPTAVLRRLWRYDAEGTLKAVFSTPIVSAGKLYFGEGYHQDRDCRLLCLDAANGDRTLWSQATTSHVESTPTVEAGRIYFGAGDDGVLCVSAPANSSGAPQVVWQSRGLHVDASPAVVDGRVYVGSVAGDLHDEFAVVALDAENGQSIWKSPAPLPVAGSPAYAEGLVFVSLGNGKLNVDADDPQGKVWCLNIHNGQRRWEFSAKGSILSCPVVVDDVVYATSRDQHVYALATANGDVLWKVDLGEPVVAPPVVSGGHVFILTVAGRLQCLSAQSGANVWHTEECRTDHYDAYAGPTLSEGRLYVASGGKVYCFGD